MSNGDNKSVISEETTVRKGNRSTTKLNQMKSKINDTEIYNQCISERERLQEERKFILIFVQLILKHSRVDEELKSRLLDVLIKATSLN